MDFYAVYILEAHPTDVWQMRSNVRDGVLFSTPKSDAERSNVATACWRKLGIKFPALVDSMDNRVEAAYTGWPDRLYLIDRGGRVMYKSKPGPFGFDPDELAAAMQGLPRQGALPGAAASQVNKAQPAERVRSIAPS